MPKIKFENGVTVNVQGNPTQQDIEEIASQLGVSKAETPGGVSGAFKRGWKGLKEDLNKRVDNTGKAVNADQSGASKVLQVAGQGFGTIGDVIGAGVSTAASAITPDSIEQPIKNKFTEGVKKIMETKTAKTAMDKYEQFKNENPELAGNIEAVANIADAFTNALAVGAGAKGVKVAGKGAIRAGEAGKEAVEGVTKGAVDNVVKFGEKATQGAKKAIGEVDRGDLAKTGASFATGLEKDTIDQITKYPERFTKEAMSGVDRDAVFNKVKTAIDHRLEQLSETGKEYGIIREQGEPITILEHPVQKVLSKYGIKIGRDGKLKMSAESTPLGSGDVRAIENFMKQYIPKKGNTMSANAFLNARKALSNMSKFAEDKTDMAGTIAREIRKELDTVGKGTITGLEDLDKRFASEIKLLNKAKGAIYDRSGNVKSNAMSVITNLTGKGKEQLLPIIEKIVPGISQDVDVLKAIMDIEKTKGIKVGTYLRGATGGFLASGGNPIATILSAIATSPQVAVPAIREFSKAKPKLKEMLQKLGKGR